MWEVQKYVMRAKRVIVHNDWVIDEGRITHTVKGQVMYSFLETLADLANNKTGNMACGIPAICKASGLSRSTVIRCLAIARRYRFIIDTGERLPAPYDTIVYKMDPMVFLRLKNRIFDVYYASVEEVMADLDLDCETAALLHFDHDVRWPIVQPLLQQTSRALKGHCEFPTDEEWDAAYRKMIDHPDFYRSEKSPTLWWTAAQRRAAFLKTGYEMGLGHNLPTPERAYIMGIAAPAEGVA